MRFMIGLISCLGLISGCSSEASACDHVPVQALLQGGTCPVCSATAQSVQYQQQLIAQPIYQQSVVSQYQPAPVVLPAQQVIQYQQQPVVAVQRLLVQQPVYQSSSLSYSMPLSVQAPVYSTPLYLQGGYGGGLNLMSGYGGGLNLQVHRQGLFGRHRSLSLSAY